jgi:hypothetical protein
VASRKSAPPRRPFTASYAVERAGEVLSQFKKDDNLSFKDLGELIGKGPDQAERIAKGNAVMDMPTFLRCCEVWGSQFADRLMALVGLRTAPHGTFCFTDDEKASHTLARVLPLILIAEEEGLTPDKLRPHEKLLRAVVEKSGKLLAMIEAGDLVGRDEG